MIDFSLEARGFTKLHLAALRHDSNEVQRALARGLDPNAEDELGRTPLSCVLLGLESTNGNARRSRADALRLLLAAGADLDRAPRLGARPREVIPLSLRITVAAWESQQRSIDERIALERAIPAVASRSARSRV